MMTEEQDGTDLRDGNGTGAKIDTRLTQRRWQPVLWELVSYRGEIFGPYTSAQEAAEVATHKWPDQEQDEERSGKGWDIQVADCDR